MATLRGFNRKFYWSAKTYEGTWGTAEADAAMYPSHLDSEAFEVVPELVDDTDLIGGAEEATSQQELSRLTRGSIGTNRVQPHELAAIAAFGMGYSAGAGETVISSTVDTSAYQHIIRPNIANSVLRSFTALDLFSSTYYVQYIGCMVNSFTLSTTRKGWLTMSADIIGSGKTATTGVTVANLGAAITETYLRGGDCKVFLASTPTGTLGGTYQQGVEDIYSTPTTLTTKVLSFNWTYNNNIGQDELYELGSGLYMGRAERDRRNQTLTCALEFEDLTYLGYLTNQTELQLEFDFTSATLAGNATIYYGAQIIFPSVRLTGYRTTGGTGKLIAECESKVMINDESTPDPAVQMVVWNKQGTYLTT